MRLPKVSGALEGFLDWSGGAISGHALASGSLGLLLHEVRSTLPSPSSSLGCSDRVWQWVSDMRIITPP